VDSGAGVQMVVSRERSLIRWEDRTGDGFVHSAVH
jgi:hypothetical protein